MSYKGIKFNGKILDIPQEYLKSIDIADGVLTIIDSSETTHTFTIPEGIATEDYVRQQIATLVSSAPEALDTLGELATALEENQDIVDTLDFAITNKADKADLENYISKDEEKTLSLSVTADDWYTNNSDGTVTTSGGGQSITYSPSKGSDGFYAHKLARASSVTNLANSHNSLVGRVSANEQTISGLSAVATTGSYNDLEDIPEIPTKISQLENDRSFVTIDEVPSTENLATEEYVDEKNSEQDSEISKKLDMVTGSTSTQVYGVGSSGQQIMYPISQENATPGALVRRNGNGELVVPLTPSADKYATSKSYVDSAIAGLGTVFNLKGTKTTASDLPTEGNAIGDVWYVVDEAVGYIWLNDGTSDKWEQFGAPINLGGYVTAETFGEIETAVSELQTKNEEQDTAIASKVDASELSNYVDLTSAQTITGIKTFPSQIKFTSGNAFIYCNNSISIGHNSTSTECSVNIGAYTSSQSDYGINIGYCSDTRNGERAISLGGRAQNERAIAIGTCINSSLGTTASGKASIAIGSYVNNDTTKQTTASAEEAIQLGYGNNATAKTLQVFDYQLLDGNTGLIPKERLSFDTATTDEIDALFT